jgi:septum formation protein
LSKELVLASASKTRREILLAARISFISISPNVDEERIKEALLAKGADAAAIATALAETKAAEVSARTTGSLVLGADQVLVCEGKLFNKAENLSQARETLKYFRGRTHELISAMALVRNGETLWRHVESAELCVRDFSEAFLEEYIILEGNDILGSVGCYRIEGRGAQLFDKVTGDQFTIRGLPLFPLLAALRAREIVRK